MTQAMQSKSEDNIDGEIPSVLNGSNGIVSRFVLLIQQGCLCSLSANSLASESLERQQRSQDISRWHRTRAINRRQTSPGVRRRPGNNHRRESRVRCRISSHELSKWTISTAAALNSSHLSLANFLADLCSRYDLLSIQRASAASNNVQLFATKQCVRATIAPTIFRRSTAGRTTVPTIRSATTSSIRRFCLTFLGCPGIRNHLVF